MQLYAYEYLMWTYDTYLFLLNISILINVCLLLQCARSCGITEEEDHHTNTHQTITLSHSSCIDWVWKTFSWMDKTIVLLVPTSGWWSTARVLQYMLLHHYFIMVWYFHIHERFGMSAFICNVAALQMKWFRVHPETDTAYLILQLLF